MPLFSKSLVKTFTDWLKRSLTKNDHSLGFLNATQFLGVLNDNIFKLLVVFLLIDHQGKEKSGLILSLAGAIYVIPFLLFSSSAGILADRISKQRLTVIVKISEVVIMGLSMAAFAFTSEWGCYVLLFFLATHSAMFGPSKYGIIPELVPKDFVSKANGLITSFTYLAMILGTFMGSFITEITNRNFVITGLFCLFIALVGLICAFGIRKTPPQGSRKEMNLFFIREIIATLKFSRNIKFLAPAIFGASYFLFIGSFTQLNIIPFAIDSLGLKEVAGGYLFLATAIGIAVGSFFCGKLMRKRLELGVSCIAGIVIGLSFLMLGFFSHSLGSIIFFLILLGIAGGAFIIPFDSFIQINSPVEKRGQVIAAANFFSFSGVLLASIVLYFFSEIFHLSPPARFGAVGAITLFVSFILFLRLAGLTFPYIAKKMLFPLLKVKLENAPSLQEGHVLVILENASPLKVLLASGVAPSMHFLINKKSKYPFWYRWIQSLDEINLPGDIDAALHQAKAYLNKHPLTCLLLEGTISKESNKGNSFLLNLFKRERVYVMQIVKEPVKKEIHVLFNRCP